MDLLSSIPPYFRQPPVLIDELETSTSTLQAATVNECLPLLKAIEDPSRSPFDFNQFGVFSLQREDHVRFLHENLAQFPARFVGIDASRPWMVYWALAALHMLGEDVSSMRSRVVKTFYPSQNKTGGFGGGHGQLSHLAGVYATLLSLAIVGGEEAYSLVDRKSMWQWLGRLKQPDGGFRISEGGEEDVRGAYCALVAVSLLNLPLSLPPDSPARSAGFETFFDGLGEYISRCQTYEGGIGASPGNEAHGAYAFCAIACLCLLDSPHQSLNRYLNLDELVGWLSSRQYSPEGGLAGRTNKVVDGCYSHWLGGCWPLVQAAISGPRGSPNSDSTIHNLYSSEGLARYILCCCQAEDGGLRDKPSKRPDSYHTCYTLAGVSLVEHRHTYGSVAQDTTEPFETVWTWEARKAEIPSETDPSQIFEAGADLSPLHPVYAIPHQAVRDIREWSLRNPVDFSAAGAGLA